MTDYFALLQEPRRPWIDSDSLRQRFLGLTAAAHPDRTHGESEAEREAKEHQYAELNAAYQCLREPKDRLAHLIELERGVRPGEIHPVDAPAIELFTEVNELCREADRLLVERGKATSPLLKAQRFADGVEMTERLRALADKLVKWLRLLEQQLKHLNMAWESAPAIGSPTRIHMLPCSRLEQIHRELNFLCRCIREIDERLVRLSV